MGPVVLDDIERRGFTLRRAAAAAVLLVMAALYVSPLQKYLHQSDRMRSDRAAVTVLERQHAHLEAQLAGLQTKSQIIVLARACGWIFPGETPLVVRDVPDTSVTRCG